MKHIYHILVLFLLSGFVSGEIAYYCPFEGRINFGTTENFTEQVGAFESSYLFYFCELDEENVTKKDNAELEKFLIDNDYGEYLNPSLTHITIKKSDFLGVCNYDNDSSLTESLKCISNFLDPSIKLGLLYDPFFKLYSDVFVYGGNPISNIVSLPYNFLIFVVNFFINVIRFILHFVFRFAIIYLIWVSLGVQVLMQYISRGRGLEHGERVALTFIIMAICTIYVFSGGLSRWF